MNNFYFKLSLLSLFCVSLYSFSQSGNVGINTDKPEVTLQINGHPTIKDKADGLRAPIITGNQLSDKNNAYQQNQKGTLIYVTDAADNQHKTGKTVNVDSPGYYYFDGSVWVKVTDTNIYKNDGTLQSNRLVTMGNNTLTFSGNNTSFVKNDEAISVKSESNSQANYIGFYRNGGGTARTGYLGFSSSNGNDFSIKNEVKDGNIKLENNSEVTGHLKITDLDQGGATSLIGVNENGILTKTATSNFVSAKTFFAKKPVDAQYKDGETDLGIQISITVPAGQKYAIISQYSVPGGITKVPETFVIGNVRMAKQFHGYIGVTMYRKEDSGNFTDVEAAARKYTIPYNIIDSAYPVTTMNAQYYEEIDNINGKSPKTITYKLKGRVELSYYSFHSDHPSSKVVMQSSNQKYVRFNMWDNDGSENYHWGKGSISYQAYRLEN